MEPVYGDAEEGGFVEGVMLGALSEHQRILCRIQTQQLSRRMASCFPGIGQAKVQGREKTSKGGGIIRSWINSGSAPDGASLAVALLENRAVVRSPRTSDSPTRRNRILKFALCNPYSTWNHVKPALGAHHRHQWLHRRPHRRHLPPRGILGQGHRPREDHQRRVTRQQAERVPRRHQTRARRGP